MVKIEMLEQERKKKGITNEQIASALGVDLSTWYRKKKNPISINIGEIECLASILALSGDEAKKIFLD